MKIGVLGGTFDPIHLGHICLARAAFQEYSLDRLWFMPAGDPYFKEAGFVTDAAVRLEMTKRCVDALPDPFECSDFEINDKEITYSAETFSRLKTLYPEDEFYFVMGEDALRSLGSWYKPELIFKNAVILSSVRKNYTLSVPFGYVADEISSDINGVIQGLKEKFKDSYPDIRIIHAEIPGISSTRIRQKKAAGEDIFAYVTPETAEYIYSHGLYQ